MNLPSKQLDLSPNECLCVGCFQVKEKGSCYTGKLNKGVSFAEKVTEELTFNPLIGKVEVETVTKKFPIGKWARGFICRACASDYRTVKHVRRNGEVWFEPVVILDPSSTLTQTINGGDSFIPSSSMDHDDGFGFSQELSKPEIDVKSYQALLGGRKKGNRLNDVIQELLKDDPPVTSNKSQSQLNAEAS